MKMFDFTIDDESVGQTIGPSNGFPVNSEDDAGRHPSTKRPTTTQATQQFKSGYFVFGGSGERKTCTAR